MVRVIQISDTHLSPGKQHFVPNWEPVATWLRAQRPDFVIHTGDVTVDGTPLWLDGGPVRFTAPIDGVAVVHRVAVEHRSLTHFETNHSTADLADDQLAAVTHPGGAAEKECYADI